MKFDRNYISFIQENAFENVVCQNGGHFVQGKMSQTSSKTPLGTPGNTEFIAYCQ